MSQVRIVPSAKSGSVVSAYESNPEFGYIQLEQSAHVAEGGWIREVKRSTLMRGEVPALEKFVKSNPTLTLPGNLTVNEFVEDEIPTDIANRFLNKKVAFEEAIEPFLKRAGQDGPVLTLDGKRIVRFTIWDMAGESFDITVSHDNQAEVTAARAATAVLGKK
jgi:hypothetical protein